MMNYNGMGRKGYVFGVNSQIILPYDMESDSLIIKRELFEQILKMIPSDEKTEKKIHEPEYLLIFPE